MRLQSILKMALLLTIPIFATSQSIRESETNYYNTLTNGDLDYFINNPNSVAAMPPREKSNCNLNKVVYGWHPYWMLGAEANYDFDLLSHFSYFSYEVNSSTGNAVTTHNWATDAAVTTALASGNTKVTLCVSMFSGHSTFFGSSTSKQTLITNLINLVSSRGAHGVNIDFEGVPSSQSTNFANFMVDLSTQMKAAISGAEISMALYAVDWSNLFDFSIMNAHVDHFIIMGYDYYYKSSSTAGPCAPLYHFGNTYNYTLSKSTSFYLNAGCPIEKLVLGIPYYGYDWRTQNLSVPSTTTSTGVARKYKDIKNNSNGYFTSAYHSYDADSYTDIYAYNNGNNRQAFVISEDGYRKRLEFVNRAGLAGMGIWALGYDDGYLDLWNAIEDYMTDCQTDSCASQIHDFGGPTKDYYNNENYTWTIAPPSATSLTFNFTQFDVENSYDFLYIYDGADVNAPQIAGSPFTGTVSPGTFTSSTGSVTFRWTSDAATVAPGFIANYTCNTNTDVTPPTTTVSTPNTWETSNFTASFSDNDNNIVQEKFYLVSDNTGTEWDANASLGFFYDEFNSGVINTKWTNNSGTWSITSGQMNQTDEANTNSNIYASLTQNNSQTYLYHWTGKIDGTGANRRAGIHFFCDDATQTQRGNSYMVYFRIDNNKCQIYNALGNSITIQSNDNVTLNANTNYDFKVLYNPISGLIQAYVDDILVSEWTDPNPLTTGNAISLRTGNCNAFYDDFEVFKGRTTNELITVGAIAGAIRYQNVSPSSPSGSIKSLVIDNANNWSTLQQNLINIDWTNPSNVNINDGIASDISVFNNNTQISANWNTATDTHSGIALYEYAIGTSAGATNTVNWTSNGTSNTVTKTGLSLAYNTTYYVSVRTTNGAGLTSAATTSNGQLLTAPSGTPVAGFSLPTTTVCEGGSIQLVNNSTNATSFNWTTNGGSLSSTSAQNPFLTLTTSGTYTITLIATGPGGTDTDTQNITITVLDGPTAIASPDYTTVNLPNAIVSFTNNSTNATSYYWDFGNGNTSTDQNPWNEYVSIGTYTVMLVAMKNGCGNDTTYFTITVEDVIGVSERTFENTIAYPNPFTNSIIIKGINTTSNTIQVELFDMSGRLIYTQSFAPTNIVEIKHLEQISKGVYQLRIETGLHSRVFNLLK